MTPEERKDAKAQCDACWIEVAPILRRHSTSAAITVLSAILAQIMSERGLTRAYMVDVLDASIDAVRAGRRLS